MSALATIAARPTGVLTSALALVIAGAYAVATTPVEWVPSTTLARATVTATWPGNAPRTVERYVTAPLERAAAATPGAALVESVSENGRSVVTAGVRADADPDAFVAELAERAGALGRELPDGVSVRVDRSVPEALRQDQGFVTYQLVGSRPPLELRALADEVVGPAFAALGDVAGVEVRGSGVPEIVATLDPGRLAAAGLTALDVASGLRPALVGRPLGVVRDGDHEALVFQETPEGTDAVGGAVVAAGRDAPPVLLRDVATVAVRGASKTSLSRVDGAPVVVVELSRVPGTSLIRAADAVHRRAEAARQRLPPDVRLLVAEDRSADARAELARLAVRGGAGVALVALALALMLGSARSAGAVLLSAAAATAVALVATAAAGLSFNVITLAGFTLTFGLLVDNGAVVAERVTAERAWGDPAAAARSVRAAWPPLLGGTVSTVAVLAPAAYLSGELRAVFVPLGLVLSTAMAASLVTAAVVVPAVLGASTPRRPPAPWRWTRWVASPYALAAEWPWLTGLAAAAALGLPIFLLPASVAPGQGDTPAVRAAVLYNATLGRPGLRAPLDAATGGILRPFVRAARFQSGVGSPPGLAVALILPSGGSLGQADALVRPFESDARAAVGVDRVLLSARSDARLGPTATVRVSFTRAGLLSDGPFRLREAFITRATRLSGVDVAVTGLGLDGFFSSSGRTVSGVTVEASGPNYDTLDSLVERASAVIALDPRVSAVHRSASPLGPRSAPVERLAIRWDGQASERTGLTSADAVAALAPQLIEGGTVVRPAGPGRPAVRLQLGGERPDFEDLTNRPIAANDSTRFRLGDAATVDRVSEPGAVVRRAQRYERVAVVDYAGPFAMATASVDAALRAVDAPPGYTIDRADRGFDPSDRRALWFVALAALALVWLISAAVLESWRLAAAVLAALPAALGGVAAAFLATGLPLSRGAFVGGVLLVGLAVNDALLLAAEHRRISRAHPSLNRGPVAALTVRCRLRPMWTTSVTSTVALLPVLVVPTGGLFWSGLAVVVVGGLAGSTVLGPALVAAALPGVPRERRSRG